MAYTDDDSLWDIDLDDDAWYTVPDDQKMRMQKYLPEDLDDDLDLT